MKNYKIDVKKAIRYGIEDEIQDLLNNGNIRFADEEGKEKFISDLLSEMLEQYENDTIYYGSYNPNFVLSVSDKIEWDKDYYGITIID